MKFMYIYFSSYMFCTLFHETFQTATLLTHFVQSYLALTTKTTKLLMQP